MRKTIIATIICLLLSLLFMTGEAKAEILIKILPKRWNLISTPLQAQDTSVSQVFWSITGQYRDVWGYDCFDLNDPWKHYHPNYISFSDLDKIEVKQGYWIYLNGTAILILSGAPVSTNQTIPLKQGWNLIGWPFLYKQLIAEALSSLTLGVDYDRIIRFNPFTQTQETFLGQTGVDEFDTFEPGKGYYIYALQDCTITFLLLPRISITQPAPNSLFNTPEIEVQGTIDDNNTTVEVNSIPATVSNKAFSANIILQEDLNTITAVATNQAGNSASDSIVVTLDTIAPAKPVFSPVTSPTSQNTQTLSGTKEVNSSIWINGVEEVPLNSSDTWQVSVSLSEGNNSFSITSKDSASNESDPVVANILLDTSAPTIPSVTDDGVYSTSNTQLHASWQAEDPDTNVVGYQYRITQDSTFGQVIVDWTPTVATEITKSGLSLTEGTTYYFCVKAKNKAVLWSEIGYSDGIIVDTQAPTGSISINNGNDYTNLVSVTLNLSATDTVSGTSKMRFSNDNVNWSSPEGYNSTKSWTIPSGDGQKTVYARFKDNAGNWSQSLSDTVTMDTVAPEIIITSPEDGAIVDTEVITLQGTIDGESFTETRTLQSEGNNVLIKEATDLAGNTSSASITVYLYLGEDVGPAGGEVLSPEGKVKVIIPAGALSEVTRIKVIPLDNETLQDATPQDCALLTAVQCEPYGLNFNSPVQLIYSLPQAEVAGTSVELGLYDPVTDEIIPTGQKSAVEADGYTVIFSIDHFSTYAALASLVSQGQPIGPEVEIPLPDMFTGSFSHPVPIAVPPGRQDMQPDLQLMYRSSNANSWVGFGFSLNPGYIVRSTRLGPPTYVDEQDTFYLVTNSGTTELVYLVDNLYQAKIESSFTKFYKETDDSWRVVAKYGSTLIFGKTADSKETSGQGTFSWYITKALDTNGNYVAYAYTKDQGKSYLNRIDYTGNEKVGFSPNHRIEFLLESRDDVFSSYLSSSKIATAKRLKEIQVKANGNLAWKYNLVYEYSADTNRSLLKSITQYAADGEAYPTQSFVYQAAR